MRPRPWSPTAARPRSRPTTSAATPVHTPGRAAAARLDRRRGRQPLRDQGSGQAGTFPADRRRGRRRVVRGGPPARRGGGLPLGALRIGQFDGDLYDTRSAWLRHRQIGSDGAILVRPDRFIAWRHATSAEDREPCSPTLSGGSSAARPTPQPPGPVLDAVLLIAQGPAAAADRPAPRRRPRARSRLPGPAWSRRGWRVCRRAGRCVAVDLLADEGRHQGRAHQQAQQWVLELTREHGEWSRANGPTNVRRRSVRTPWQPFGRQPRTALLAGG
jgi:hypothetical protein